MRVLVSRVLFYFLFSSQPPGIQGLRRSDGAELAKRRPAGPGRGPRGAAGFCLARQEKNTVMTDMLFYVCEALEARLSLAEKNSQTRLPRTKTSKRGFNER